MLTYMYLGKNPESLKILHRVRPSGTISTVPEECGYYRAITATDGMRLMIQSAAHLKFCKYVSLLVAAIYSFSRANVSQKMVLSLNYT